MSSNKSHSNSINTATATAAPVAPLAKKQKQRLYIFMDIIRMQNMVYLVSFIDAIS